MRYSRYLTFAVLMIVAVLPAGAAEPLGTSFTYQGRLAEDGELFNGNVSMLFELYDAGSGGNLIGTQSMPSVRVSDGVFTVQLNAAGELGSNAFVNESRWLQITVNGTPLARRQPVTATPFALALRLPYNAAATVNADGEAVFTIHNNAIDGQNAAIQGINSSGSGYGLFGTAFGVGAGVIGTTNLGDGVVGQTDGMQGRGVLGINFNTQSTTAGVQGSSVSGMATAVRGVNFATSGTAIGVKGTTNSPIGIGVEGSAPAGDGINYGGRFIAGGSSGRGVHGEATALNGPSYGGYFTCASAEGTGILGESTGVFGTSYGGRFTTMGNSGAAVYGQALAGGGSSIGGKFFSASISGTGVQGTGNNCGGEFMAAGIASTGVHGSALNPFGANTGGTFQVAGPSSDAVFGYADSSAVGGNGGYFRSDGESGRGVSGIALATMGPTYGVLGSANFGLGYAVYALGNSGASGTKSFRIDHPEDPENKYLLHYSTESPEVINFYRGSVVLDANGNATVTLPHYFARINKSPTYMLTPVGASMPDLFVAREIDEAALVKGGKSEPGDKAPLCTFEISGGVPGGKVCWRVEAERNDRFMQKYPALAEREKHAMERGSYQSPELYGRPPQRAKDHRGVNPEPAALTPRDSAS